MSKLATWHETLFRFWRIVPAASIAILASCAGVEGHGHLKPYALDSPSNACRTYPANCAAMLGKDGVIHQVLNTAATVADIVTAVRALEGIAKERADAVLMQCADEARSRALIRYMKGLSPTREQCLEKVGERHGETITRAMQLGELMHQLAFECVRDRLGKTHPGGFSLEPRYRYDPRTGKTTLMRPEEVQGLLRQGRGGELLGTIVPDVVFHTGNPLQIQDVYDFKFPCMNTDDVPRWRVYPPGHPYEGLTQGEVYKRALGHEPTRVVPRLGVVR